MKKVVGLAAFALATTLMGTVAPTTAAADPLPPGQSAKLKAAESAATMDGFKRMLAEQIARRLDNGEFKAVLNRELAGDGQADLAALFASVPGAQDLTDYTRQADSKILQLKGLQAEGEGESLLEVSADPATVKRVAAGEKPLVMFTPSKDEKFVRTVTAYDSAGRTHELDARRAPKQAVLVVGLNERKTAELGQQVIRKALTEAGVTGADRKADEAQQPTAQAAGTPRWAAQIYRITNYNDHEPWYKGGPEIYAWTMGAGTDGKARVDSIEMPYITDEGTTYNNVNQVLIEWSNFSWTAVDVVFMERDDNADLSALAKAIVEGALVATGNGQYVALADKVISALPSDWVTDSDDWVDSCYSIRAGYAGQIKSVPCAARPTGMEVRLISNWI
ncbi:DUF3103 family protein [Streptosporangium sp. NPDC049644]|uniref:DUF3103 family protein n=1 Tax=Streptosporangium sp. NPDC049644 TaxID=3155507 RepID=UPI00342F62BB